MLIRHTDWKKTADRFEGKSHKFMTASRKLNVLANDMLRYVDLCESLAHIAREGYSVKTEYQLELKKQAELAKKQKKGYTPHTAMRLNHLHERLIKINKAFAWRGKELKKIEKKYFAHIKNFSEALKS